MDVSRSAQSGVLTLTLRGRMTFGDSAYVRDALAEMSGVSRLVVDFGELEYLDSAGMGLLLLIREECEKKSIKLSFRSVKGQPEKVFKLARFYDLFEIL